MTWLHHSTLPDDLTPRHATALAGLPLRSIPQGTVLFRPGDRAEGFAVVLRGRVEVFLNGPTGRGILLYAVEPGESCVQTTLGLLADEEYAAEAVTANPVDTVIIPKSLFLTLMNESPAFRAYVFRAFGQRMGAITRILERVAFQTVEARLSQSLLGLAEAGCVRTTQADLAQRIGSAREVVSRRLDALARRGLVATERGLIRILDEAALRRLAEETEDGQRDNVTDKPVRFG